MNVHNSWASNCNRKIEYIENGYDQQSKCLTYSKLNSDNSFHIIFWKTRDGELTRIFPGKKNCIKYDENKLPKNSMKIQKTN